MRSSAIRLYAVVIASVLPTAVCGQVQVGCFDVSLGDWTPVESTAEAGLPRPPRPDVSGDSVVYSMPPRLRLHSEPSQGSDRSFLVTVPESSLQVPHSFLSWSGTPDSLTIVLSTRYAGTISKLRATSDGWTGTSRTFSDVIGLLRYERPVTLHRVDCDSEPSVPASADKQLPRSVELQDHSPLVLGQPLPAGVVHHPLQSSRVRTLEVEPAGMWAGADTVIVRLNDQDTVYRIEVRYSRGFDLSPLVRDLASKFGLSDDQPGTSSFWENRTTTMFVRTDESLPRAVIYDPRLERR